MPHLVDVTPESAPEAPVALSSGVPGVWLTPLLNRPEVTAALSEADDRHLAIDGTADRHSIPQTTTGTRAQILEIPDADHSLRGSDWRRSLELQTAVFEQIAAHPSSSA